MPARLSIHVPGQPVLLRVIEAGCAARLGRDPAADIVIPHDSVSRLHARIASVDEAWRITDLGSKNGIRVDGERVAEAGLDRGCWFALGDVFCEFEPIDASARAHLAARDAERRSTSRAWTARIERRGRTDELVADLLRGIVEIAECERGFLLTYDADQQLVMRACHSLLPDDIAGAAFSGSRGAVERALLHRRPVYSSDQRDHAWLGAQASVIARGLRAIACLPLLHGGELLGVAYADSGDEAKVFTELDAELLGAFVERASTALAIALLDEQIAGMSSLLAVGAEGSRDIGVAPAWPVAPTAPGRPA